MESSLTFTCKQNISIHAVGVFVAEVHNVTFVFIDTVDSDKSETFHNGFTFYSTWTLAVVTTMEINACSIVTTKWYRSHCTYVYISTTHFRSNIIAFTSKTFLASAFETTIGTSTGSIDIAVMCFLSTLVDISAEGVVIVG